MPFWLLRNNLMLSFATIAGACVGFEYLYEDMVQAVHDNAKWGIRLELLFFRVVYIQF